VLVLASLVSKRGFMADFASNYHNGLRLQGTVVVLASLVAGCSVMEM